MAVLWRRRGRRPADFEALVVERVREIPYGSVSTYGDIDRKAPRRVGFVLATTQEELPWQRVVRADGGVPMGAEQLELLRREGVPIKGRRVDLARARYSEGDQDPAGVGPEASPRTRPPRPDRGHPHV